MLITQVLEKVDILAPPSRVFFSSRQSAAAQRRVKLLIWPEMQPNVLCNRMKKEPLASELIALP